MEAEDLTHCSLKGLTTVKLATIVFSHICWEPFTWATDKVIHLSKNGSFHFVRVVGWNFPKKKTPKSWIQIRFFLLNKQTYKEAQPVLIHRINHFKPCDKLNPSTHAFTVYKISFCEHFWETDLENNCFQIFLFPIFLKAEILSEK